MDGHDHTHEADAARRLAEAGRAAIRKVWSHRALAAQLSAPERELLAVLERHPQFEAYWAGAEPPAEQNPFLHVLYHEVVLKQLAAADPPEAADAVARLAAAGVDRHDAEHRVMEVFITEMFEMLKERAVFDRARYQRRLNELTP